ncbi:MAG: preprotein translocase subunit SecE [Acidimicrobiales bacterium]
MTLNREQKRMLKKRGELADDGETPVAQRRQQPSQRPPAERTSPGQFAKEVRSELRKVAWPSWSETRNYSIVVIVTIAVLAALIFGLDWLFNEFVFQLFQTN